MFRQSRTSRRLRPVCRRCEDIRRVLGPPGIIDDFYDHPAWLEIELEPDLPANARDYYLRSSTEVPMPTITLTRNPSLGSA